MPWEHPYVEWEKIIDFQGPSFFRATRSYMFRHRPPAKGCAVRAGGWGDSHTSRWHRVQVPPQRCFTVLLVVMVFGYHFLSTAWKSEGSPSKQTSTCVLTVPSRTWLQFLLPVWVGDDGEHGISISLMVFLMASSRPMHLLDARYITVTENGKVKSRLLGLANVTPQTEASISVTRKVWVFI